MFKFLAWPHVCGLGRWFSLETPLPWHATIFYLSLISRIPSASRACRPAEKYDGNNDCRRLPLPKNYKAMTFIKKEMSFFKNVMSFFLRCYQVFINNFSKLKHHPAGCPLWFIYYLRCKQTLITNEQKRAMNVSK